MDVAVIGGDLRNAYLVQMLRARGLDARAVALATAELPGVRRADWDGIAGAETLVLNSPLRAELAGRTAELADVLRCAAKGSRLIFVGPQPAPAVDEAFFSLYDLAQDEEFLARNARLTAEGAIHAALDRLPDSIAGLRTLVIGWGRLGRALTELLVGLGAEATVASRSPKGRSQALARGARAADTAQLADVLGGMELVFSTPPAPVLDAAVLARATRGAHIVDLASPPYGVDLAAAERLGLVAWREPGLPGRYCPRSAGRVLADGVREILRRERGNRT